MPADPISSATTTKLIGLTVDVVVSKVNSARRQYLTAKQVADIKRNAISRVRTLSKMKPFWSPDEDVLLIDFYHPTRLRFGSRAPQPVRSLGSFPNDHNYVITGTVGQGKSVLLQYLALQEVLDPLGTRIPILLEFRHLRPNQPVIDFIHSGFAALGLTIDYTTFGALCASGKFVLMLDAFDEIPDTRAADCAYTLESLAGTHPNLQIVLTSRPFSHAQGLRGFTHAEIEPLGPDDHEKFCSRPCQIRSKSNVSYRRCNRARRQ